MEIILLQKINKLGSMGDIVQVKSGFGRNFLIPTGKALRATKENKELFEKTKAKLLEENKAAIENAQKLREEVEALNLIVVRSASDAGVLYGSVTTRDISNLIAQNGITISRKLISLDKPIKELGTFDTSITLHPEVESKIKLKVVRSLEEKSQGAEDGIKVEGLITESHNELNESMLEDGVSLKTEGTESEVEKNASDLNVDPADKIDQ